MEKFSEKSFNDIISMQEELEEIFQSLKDHGFEFNLSTYYTNREFSTISSRILDRIDFYYYGFEISLRRSVSEENSHQWNGSLYYESDISLIDDIHNSIGRLINEYPDYKVYYNFRDTNEINIRVIMGKNENKEILYNFEKLRKLVSRFSDIEVDGYRVHCETASGGRSFSFPITLTKDGYDLFSSKSLTSKDKIISNEEYYVKFFDKALEILKGFLIVDPKIKLRVYEDDGFRKRGFISYVDGKGVVCNIIEIRLSISDLVQVQVGKFLSKKTLEVYQEGCLFVKIMD